ncbi:sugar transporter [Colletotrichum incanum]|nr:sugar transporter [Colletotrichum incanum]
MVAMVLFLPESPRWLIARGYDEEAKDVLEWITPRPSDQIGTDHIIAVENLYQTIILARETEKAAEGEFSYAELLRGGKVQNWRRMALCAGIMACQQLSGINLLTYYISYVLQNSVGLDRHTSLLVGGINGLEYLAAAMIPMWTIEKFGRRKLLLFSACGQTISMAILAGAIWYVTSKPDGEANYAMGILAVACFFLFNTCYAQGFLAIPFFYPAEITTLRTRSKGVSLSVMSNWLFTFLVVMITPICTMNIGWKLTGVYRTYIIFTVLNFSFIPLIYFFLPETAGLSLEALDSVFDFPGVTRGVLSKKHRRDMLAMSSEGGAQLVLDDKASELEFYATQVVE